MRHSTRDKGNLKQRHQPRTCFEFKCGDCHFVAAGRGQFLKHSMARHNKPTLIEFMCGDCDFVTRERLEFRRHSLREHCRYSIKCSCCRVPVKFKKWTSLERHEENMKNHLYEREPRGMRLKKEAVKDYNHNQNCDKVKQEPLTPPRLNLFRQVTIKEDKLDEGELDVSTNLKMLLMMKIFNNKYRGRDSRTF